MDKLAGHLIKQCHDEHYDEVLFIGHSVGEYTALFCSGMLGFEDAMGLIIKRSDLMYESTLKEPGKIMVVFKVKVIKIQPF